MSGTIPMLAYAGRTGTVRNLNALREAGWRLMVTPAKPRTEGFRYGLDNGAWTAHQQRQPWDEDGFRRALAILGDSADFVVVPDIVAGGMQSLERSMAWLPQVLERTERALIPVQDGMEPCDLRGLLGPNIGLFIGGSTEWKIATALAWGRLAAETGCYLHIGRVNTVRRINLCQAASADSFDGTSVTRYAVNLPRLDAARRQTTLFKIQGEHQHHANACL